MTVAFPCAIVSQKIYQVMLFHKWLLYFLLVQIQQYTGLKASLSFLTVLLQLRMALFLPSVKISPIKISQVWY